MTSRSAGPVVNALAKPDAVPVVLNEIFAHNVSLVTAAGSQCGWVELWNPSIQEVDLSRLSLSDRPEQPRRWIFPEGTRLPGRSFHRIFFDPKRPESATNAPFALPTQGGSVSLYDRPEQGGAELDALTYGIAAADYALGRVPDGGNVWRLTQPTELGPNVEARLGRMISLRINEWMVDPEEGADWFELVNLDSAPVSLGGLFLTNDPRDPIKSPIRPLSFLGTGRHGFAQFFADRKAGANHVNFQLAKSGATLALFAGSGVSIDVVSFGSQLKGVSQGRVPDGSSTWARFPGTATPGAPNSNVAAQADADEDGIPDSWEQLHGLKVGLDDAGGDSDGDGLINRDEYLAGTDPQSAASCLRLMVQNEGGVFLWLSFDGVVGRSYTVQTSSALAPLKWERWRDVPTRETSGPVTLQDAAPDPKVRLYRVITPTFP
ncbi:MAG: lamin tail domain-containing protein [Verrucomicrobia bacterium]|nr:lamin tail domain-containing protein [Verrucomicrobiota bacterium]